MYDKHITSVIMSYKLTYNLIYKTNSQKNYCSRPAKCNESILVTLESAVNSTTIIIIIVVTACEEQC